MRGVKGSTEMNVGHAMVHEMRHTTKIEEQYRLSIVQIIRKLSALSQLNTIKKTKHMYQIEIGNGGRLTKKELILIAPIGEQLNYIVL